MIKFTEWLKFMPQVLRVTAKTFNSKQSWIIQRPLSIGSGGRGLKVIKKKSSPSFISDGNSTFRSHLFRSHKYLDVGKFPRNPRIQINL